MPILGLLFSCMCRIGLLLSFIMGYLQFNLKS